MTILSFIKKHKWSLIVIICMMGIFLLSSVKYPYDSTDDFRNKIRSGLTLYIDNLTGCHYLSKPWGELLPRRDAHGKHICIGQERKK